MDDDLMVGKTRRSRAATEGVEVIQKPHVVEEYNQFMGGVDKSTLYILSYKNVQFLAPKLSQFCSKLVQTSQRIH